MSPVVLTAPAYSVEAVAGLVLSDGQTTLNLLGSPPTGLYLVELTPPITPRENTYVLGPEGNRRRRSRPQNAVGSARVRIDRMDEGAAEFQSDVDALQEMVESAHKRKGTLAFEPPNLDEVTYDIESCQITEAPADGMRMTRRLQEFVIEFECKPWGRLEPVELLTDEPLVGPIDGVEIPTVAGHVDALAELVVLEANTGNSDFLEFGIGQQGYDPDEPLQVARDDLDIGGDFAGEQPGGSGEQIEATLTGSSVAVAGSGVLRHNGRQKITARVAAPDSTLWVRMAYKLSGGDYSYGRWIEVAPTDWREVTLGVIDIGDDESRLNVELHAFAADGSGDIYMTDFEIIPAEVCGRIRADAADQPALKVNSAAKFTSEGGFRVTLGGVALFAKARHYGDTLRIPASTAANLPSILVIRRRTYDIDAGELSDGLEDEVTVTLTVTPRVALF